MANGGLVFVILLQFILVNNIYCASEITGNSDEYYRPQIHALVRHLNQNVNRVYNYHYATLISAQNKDDSTDIIVDIDLECRIPELCTTVKATCYGTVLYNVETNLYDVLPDVSCQPKVRIDLTKDEEPEEPIVEEEKFEEVKAEVSTEQSTKGNSVLCLGCPVNINVEAEGVNDLTNVAVQHIESERENKLAVIKVLNVQRQIVAGVKYTLLLEVANTFCPKTVEPEYLESCVPDTATPTEICQITYFQQPWINKKKHIIGNNCTHSQQFAVEVPEPADNSNDMDNEIDANYNFGKPVSGEDMGGIMSPTRMREMESQIVYRKPVEQEEEPSTTTESRLSEAQKAAIEDFLDMMGDEPRQKRSVKDNNDNNNDDSSSSSSSSEENDDKINDDNNNDDNNHEDEKKSKLKHKKYKHQDNNENDDDNNDNNNNNDDSSSSSSSDSSSDEENNHNHNQIDKQKHKKRTRRSVDNKIEDSNETSEEQDVKNEVKKEEIKDNTSEESSEEQNKQITEPKEEKAVDEKRIRRNADYGLTKITSDEKILVHNLATVALNELDQIDSDNHKRLVLQMLGAKKMYDNGYVYHLTMRVGVSSCEEEPTTITDLKQSYPKDDCRDKLFENLTKICKIQIHVNDNKEEPKILKSHCQDIKKDVSEYTHKPERGNRTHRDKRGGGLVGGISNVDPASADIQKYTKELFTQLSAETGKTHEIDEVLSASRQVVAGFLTRLKVRGKVDGITRVCSYEVWERSWITPPKEVKETCEDDKTTQEYRFRRSLSHHHFGEHTDDHDIHIGLFKKYMTKFNKKYEDRSEFKRRFKIFRQNMKKVYYLNQNEQGTAKYGPTIFADLTEKEFAQYKGLDLSLRHNNHIPYPHAVIPNIDLPVEFDWRKKGVISEVKNQGNCGSCWAFSVTGNIEGLNAIKTGNMVELSEQELVDCDSMDNGCGGGYMDNAYRAIENLGGLETETDYPYEAENEKCHFNKSMTKVQISGAVNISRNEIDMAKWLVKNGPISIGINANAMQFYMGGISHPWKFLCNPESIDHGVLLVGFGIHKYPLFNKTMPYWIVKNSWGTTWGEQGYYRVFRGDGTCGVNSMPESAIL